MHTKWIVPVLVLISMGLLLKPAPDIDIHNQIQQRLLEAELGSATAFHFASEPQAPVPDHNPTGVLLTRLESSSPETRWEAAQQLAVRRDPRAVEAVIRAMQDPQGTIRVCVMASALGHLKDPRALSALTEAAFDPLNRDLRLCAVRSLGMIGDRRAVPALIDALQAGNTPLAAANAIARMGDERGVQPIIAAAADAKLRLWMIMALGELGSPLAVPWLETVTKAARPALQRAADEAQWKIMQLAVNDPVQSLTRVLTKETTAERRMWAAFRLGELGRPQAIPALTHALADDEPSVQSRAAAALIRIGSAAVPAVTQSTIEAKGPPQRYAAAILGYIGNREQLAVLQSIADQPGDPAAIAVATRSIQLIHSFHQPAAAFVSLKNP